PQARSFRRTRQGLECCPCNRRAPPEVAGAGRQAVCGRGRRTLESNCVQRADYAGSLHEAAWRNYCVAVLQERIPEVGGRRATVSGLEQDSPRGCSLEKLARD